MPILRSLFAVVALTFLLSACGDDESSSGDTTSTSTVESTSSSVETSTATSSTTSTPAMAEQLAIWPASDVVFDTPEEAAMDFVSKILGVEPTLGEFQRGDSRSGEIEVFSPGEGDATIPIVRSTLLLRQLGADNGWFILAAVNDNTTITAPEARDEVPASPLVIEGRGRGFEANLVVSAYVVGTHNTQVDEVITMGGAMETPEPFTVTLDLSAAVAGDSITLLVRGGTGLTNDPGEFSAIPVVIASS